MIFLVFLLYYNVMNYNMDLNENDENDENDMKVNYDIIQRPTG